MVDAPSLFSAVDAPFSRWSKDEVSTWLHEQGLGLYAAQGQNWIKSGQTLLQASQHDLEKVGELHMIDLVFLFQAGFNSSFRISKAHNLIQQPKFRIPKVDDLFLCLRLQELGMKHPLHRKKLQLALQAVLSEEDDLKGKLDHNWVTSEWDVINGIYNNEQVTHDFEFQIKLPVVLQDGLMTSASHSTRVTLTRLVLTGACCTT